MLIIMWKNENVNKALKILEEEKAKHPDEDYDNEIICKVFGRSWYVGYINNKIESYDQRIAFMATEQLISTDEKDIENYEQFINNMIKTRNQYQKYVDHLMKYYNDNEDIDDRAINWSIGLPYP